MEEQKEEEKKQSIVKQHVAPLVDWAKGAHGKGLFLVAVERDNPKNSSVAMTGDLECLVAALVSLCCERQAFRCLFEHVAYQAKSFDLLGKIIEEDALEKVKLAK